jgi:hypothetical protein
MRRLLPTILALIVLAGLIALFRIAQRFDPSAGRGPGYREAGMGDVSVRLANTLLIAREAGRTQWQMRADRIELRRGANDDLEYYRSADFTGIRDGVLYREGRPETFFTARQATFDQPQQRFDVRGDIRLRSAKGDTIQAEECLWSERDDFVRLPQGARGVFRGQKISTPNLLYSPRRRLLECPQGADAVLDGHPLRAAALYWDVEKQRINCPGFVSGSRKSLTYFAQDVVYDLKARTLKANKGWAQIRIEGQNDEWEGFR